MARSLNESPVAGLRRLLSPRSIAVVGGDAAAIVISNCQRLQFEGDIHAIHPSRQQLANVPCVASPEQLPDVPDACFVGVSAERSVALVETLSRLGAGGAVCYASSFSESGTAGEARESRLVEGANGMPLMGPNCHGFINFLDGVALWPDHFGGQRVEQGPALVMQSGNMGINVTFQQRGLAPAYVIAMGNNAALGVHDYLHALLDDPRVTAIGLHLESIDDVTALSVAARRAARQHVPLVALKSGSTQLGADLALSHTRALARPDALVTLLFERLGIARCHTLPEFIETLKLVSVGGAIVPRSSDADERSDSVGPDSGAMNGQTRSARVVSMSCSGGEASHVADLAGTRPVVFPSLRPATESAVSSVLGPQVCVSNPLDYHTYVWGDRATLTAAFTALFADHFDCALLILDYPPEDFDVSAWEAAEQALCDAATATQTRVVVVSSLPENMPASARQRLMRAGVAPMQGLPECLDAIAHAKAIGQVFAEFDDAAADTEIQRATGATRVYDEHASKRMLVDFGMSCPTSLVDRAEVIAAHPESVTSQLGVPLVLKACGADFAHKTELNAVRLGISSSEELAQQAKELGLISAELLAEQMVSDVVAELLVGVRYESSFGLVLTLGAGGVGVEWLGDYCEVLLPASRRQLAQALRSLKIARVLNGYRGRPAADWPAMLDAIESICGFALAHRAELVELDVNPLLVRSVERTDKGPGAMAADALIATRSSDGCQHGPD